MTSSRWSSTSLIVSTGRRRQDGIVGYHDIAEDAPRRSRTAPGTGRLACTVEVVHGARRHDEVEVALRQ
ncbi:MAG TPA: hypothetical protein VNB87_05495 [Propionibacteriaceae bacterium]|nr:hypothetical protein [Propionibacteriaceae bacterium]